MGSSERETNNNKNQIEYRARIRFCYRVDGSQYTVAFGSILKRFSFLSSSSTIRFMEVKIVKLLRFRVHVYVYSLFFVRTLQTLAEY